MRLNVVQLSDYVWVRTVDRLDGLTDEEYLWEPVSGCWSIRPGPDGIYRPDWSPDADPPPFTSLAWRMFHLTCCYGAKRNREWLGLPSGATTNFEADAPAPATAQAAIETLTAAHAEWDAVSALLSDAALSAKLGPVAGQYAEANKADFVLHMVDEFIHHAAEIALLRDLWRVRSDLRT
jgi:hypothetical protein